MDEPTGGNLTNILLGGGVIGASLWAAWERWIKNKVMSANAEAQVAIAEAQQSVYQMLTQRLESLEKELQTVRQELSEERGIRRRLEDHVVSLEHFLRSKGLDPTEVIK